MEKEFKSLSEKVQCKFSSCRPARGEKCWHGSEPCEWVYPEEDIREFIKIIEEIVLNPKTTLIRKVAQIRAKAGDELI